LYDARSWQSIVLLNREFLLAAEMPRYGSRESTVTDFGSSFTESLPPSTLAEPGFGATALGCSKVLTLSTLGAVSVSPTADFAVMPFRLTSISAG